MTQQEKLVEKIAEFWCNATNGHQSQNHYRECLGDAGKEWWRQEAREFISTVLIPAGCMMLDEDEKWPATYPDATQEFNKGFTAAMVECERQGRSRVLPLAPEREGKA